MTATDELRRMLDERGAEWGANDTYRLLVTSWNDASGHSWAFTEHKDGSFSKLTAYHLTPEQAIAATLLEAENAKLRELCEDMYEWMGRAMYDGSARKYEYELIVSRMRELGVEVDV